VQVILLSMISLHTRLFSFPKRGHRHLASPEYAFASSIEYNF
jgi:hypothetical protein